MPFIPYLASNYAPPDDPRVVLPGAGSVSTPDSAALSGLVDIEIRVAVALDDWDPATNLDENFLARWGLTADASFRFYRGQGGFAEFRLSHTGSDTDAVATTTKIPATDGGALWVRVNHVESSGDTDFRFAPYQLDEPATWQTITLNRTTGATPMWDSAGPLRVGADENGIGQVSGDIYRVILRSAGVIVADMNPADWNGGTSWVSSTTGETWTLNGAATVAGVTPVATQRPYWGVLASR